MQNQLEGGAKRLISRMQQEGGNGGDGYWTAVERVPIAGQPVYQGYSACCPPYFTTDGVDYTDAGYPYSTGCQGGGAKKRRRRKKSKNNTKTKNKPKRSKKKGRRRRTKSKNKGRKLRSAHTLARAQKTEVVVRNGVVEGIVKTVVEKMKNGRLVTEVQERAFKKKLAPVVRRNVTQAARSLMPVMNAHRPQGRLLVVGRQQGGLIGALGTLLFPEGLAAGAVPWLLLVGAKLSQKIEGDAMRVLPRRRGTRKGMVRKTARRAYVGLKKKKRRRRTGSKKKKRRRRASRHSASRLPPLPRRRTRTLSNAEIRRIMRQRQRGGNGEFTECWPGACMTNICGDASLRPFAGCQRPVWGPRCM
jgi:hypothetical protein